MIHTKIALKRPITTIMIFVAFGLIGVLATRLLPLEQWPDIELNDGSIRIIGNTFCEQALKEVQTFFNNIFSVLPSTIE